MALIVNQNKKELFFPKFYILFFKVSQKKLITNIFLLIDQNIWVLITALSLPINLKHFFFFFFGLFKFSFFQFCFFDEFFFVCSLLKVIKKMKKIIYLLLKSNKILTIFFYRKATTATTVVNFKYITAKRWLYISVFTKNQSLEAPKQ